MLRSMKLKIWLGKPLGLPNPKERSWMGLFCHLAIYDILSRIVFKLFSGTNTHNRTLFDVGCGYGYYSVWLRKHGVKLYYVGCDINKSYLIVAREKKILESDYILCDVHYLPFKPLSAQVILCSELLEHTSNPLRVLRQLFRSASHYVVISFPDETIRECLGVRTPEHISHISTAMLMEIAKSEGFKVISIKRLNHFFPFLLMDKLKVPLCGWLLKSVQMVNNILGRTPLRTLALVKTIFCTLKKAENIRVEAN